MKHRSIRLCDWEVRVFLDGKKKTIRRVVKPQPVYSNIAEHNDLIFCTGSYETGIFFWKVKESKGSIKGSIGKMNGYDYLCPYGSIGDVLWCKETFWAKNETCDHEYCGGCDCGSMLNLGKEWCPIEYVATPECFILPTTKNNQTVNIWKDRPEPGDWWLSPNNDFDGDDQGKVAQEGVWEFLPWRYYTKHPSGHMPQWASRISLKVTGIKAQQLHDITVEEIISEGFSTTLREHDACCDLKDQFIENWNNHNKKHLWSNNPWVWVLDVDVIKK